MQKSEQLQSTRYSFFDTAKYKISKAKKKEKENERNVWQSNTVPCKTLPYDVLA